MSAYMGDARLNAAYSRMHDLAYVGLSDAEVKLASWGFVPALMPFAVLRTCSEFTSRDSRPNTLWEVLGVNYVDPQFEGGEMRVRALVDHEDTRVWSVSGVLAMWKAGRVQVIDDAPHIAKLTELHRQAKQSGHRMAPMQWKSGIQVGDYYRCREHHAEHVIGYAYPTSENAVRYGYGPQGCWVICLPWDVQACATYEECQAIAKNAGTKPGRWSCDSPESIELRERHAHL